MSGRGRGSTQSISVAWVRRVFIGLSLRGSLGHDPDLAPGGVDQAQPHDRDEARQDEERPGDEPLSEQAAAIEETPVDDVPATAAGSGADTIDELGLGLNDDATPGYVEEPAAEAADAPAFSADLADGSATEVAGSADDVVDLTAADAEDGEGFGLAGLVIASRRAPDLRLTKPASPNIASGAVRRR